METPEYETNHLADFIPEGHTMIFEAPQRRGKTLGAVIFALDAHQHGRKVFSNIQLGFAHEPLEFGDLELVDGQRKYWNGHILIDELNFFFDARGSMSKENRKFSTYLLQQKKQGCNLTGTTHALMYLDLRLRQHYDYIITPKVYPAYPAKPEVLKITVDNGPLQAYCHKTLTIPVKDYLGLYDSFAVYDPFKAQKARQSEKVGGFGKPESRGSII